MKIVLSIVALGLICAAGTVWAATPKASKERLVKTIYLQPFFHTAHAWELKIYQPVWGDAAIEQHAVRLCFTGPAAPGGHKRARRQTHCTSLYAPSDPHVVTYPCQIFESAKLELLPGAGGKGARPSLVVHAQYSSGTAGALHVIFVWTFLTWSKPTKASQGWFSKSFESDTTERGQQAFIKNGPLAGAFVSVNQVFQPGESSLESPMRFAIDVYEPGSLGYQKVLSLLSERRYPSNHTDKGTPDPIAVLTPYIARALSAVYPNGVSSVLEH